IAVFHPSFARGPDRGLERSGNSGGGGCSGDICGRTTYQDGALSGSSTDTWRNAALRIGAQARGRSTLFYFGLAAVFVIAILANLVWTWATPGVKNTSLDLAVRMRLSSPPPDPSILIVDIDERSLALLAPQHGRWPWPRSVIAEAVAGLSDAGAQS